MTSQIYSQTGALSDCKPAVFNGKATWYASNPLTAKTAYTDKKPGTATKYRIRAYRITNGKKYTDRIHL